MTDVAPTALPDRLAIDPDSPFHDADLLQRGVGIRFNGAEKTNVDEYCISEGWIASPSAPRSTAAASR
jgi:hypothetical protein